MGLIIGHWKPCSYLKRVFKLNIYSIFFIISFNIKIGLNFTKTNISNIEIEKKRKNAFLESPIRVIFIYKKNPRLNKRVKSHSILKKRQYFYLTR